MYCQNCGKQNPTGVPNCHFCGAPMAGPMQPPRKSSSNTVAIVIVVVGIVGFFFVAILAAVLFPVFARAREAARTSSCQTNMKALASAVQMYAADYNGSLPQPDQWCDLLQPMVPGKETFVCPNVSETQCGYGFNDNATSSANVQDPGRFMMLYESDGGWNAHGGSEAMITTPRHGCYNVIFIDGHFARVFPSYLGELQWTER